MKCPHCDEKVPFSRRNAAKILAQWAQAHAALEQICHTVLTDGAELRDLYAGADMPEAAGRVDAQMAEIVEMMSESYMIVQDLIFHVHGKATPGVHESMDELAQKAGEIAGPRSKWLGSVHTMFQIDLLIAERLLADDDNETDDDDETAVEAEVIPTTYEPGVRCTPSTS